MRAIVLNAANEVHLEDVRRPSPETGETLIHVSHSGICGTDLKIFQGGILVDYPRIMGHESVGEVVNGRKSSASVIVDPVYSCGICYVCLAGQPNLCPNGGLIGRDIDGGFAEYLAAPARNVYALPDEIDPAEAPLLQPMTTCLHALRLARVFPGEAVIVMGLGVTGLLHVQLAKALGAYPVIGITRSQQKLDLAQRLGADLTLQPDEHARERVLEATAGRGVDLVIESVGKLSILAQAIDFARIGGRILAFGIYTEREGALPFYDFYFKELNLISTRAAKAQDFPACIELVRRGAVKLKPVISHSLPLDELDQALDLLDGGDSSRLKIILDHSD
jgi:2-desacetyl-2-hydroxyethyl bacteriochlorophyllide A dehydrogenase